MLHLPGSGLVSTSGRNGGLVQKEPHDSKAPRLTAVLARSASTGAEQPPLNPVGVAAAVAQDVPLLENRM